MLSAVGSITQLCRIPEIGLRVFKQGALPVLEASIHRAHGHSWTLIREKGLNALSYLSRIPEVKPRMCSDKVLSGMKRELRDGTVPSQMTVMQMMLNLHLMYTQEKQFVEDTKEDILRLVKNGPWHAKNLCAKVIAVLQRTDEIRLFNAENGCLEALIKVITDKSNDLQEAPLVALLNLNAQASVPLMFLTLKGEKVVADLLFCVDEVIRDVAIVLLKALMLYDKKAVDAVIPETRAHLLLVESSGPEKYGHEYGSRDHGNLIQEYLQMIVENRREMKYLMDSVNEEEVARLAITQQEILAYEETFMELDPACTGVLDQDAIKILMTTVGYDLEDDEAEELLAKYSKSGNSEVLTFAEYLVVMHDWKTMFGEGWKKSYNTATKRGVLGRARRLGKKIWNRRKAEKEAVQVARRQRWAADDERQELAATYWDAEKIRLKREKEEQRRATNGIK